VPSHPPFSFQHDNNGLACIQTVELGNRDHLDVLAELPEESENGVYTEMPAGPWQTRRVSIPEKLHILGNDARERSSIAASNGGVPTVNQRLGHGCLDWLVAGESGSLSQVLRKRYHW
jgi:hypothetical protein